MDGPRTPVQAPSSFQRVAPDYSFQKVALAIREAIVRGELKPGDRLPPQRELQEVFGVSKVTVIGALRHLEADGVIAIQVGRHGGAIVLDSRHQSLNRALGLLLDMEQVNLSEVKELRDSVEVQIARLAAQRATPEQVTHLDQVLARLEELASAGRLSVQTSYIMLDMEFHSTLAEASGNRLLSAWMQVLRHHMLQHPSSITAQQQAELNRSLRQLVDDGIRQAQPDAAAHAMSLHLIDSYRHAQRPGATVAPGETSAERVS